MANKAHNIPEYLREKVVNMPESSYGVNCVTVKLDDGAEIPNVYVAWGKEVVKVGESKEIPFDVSRIIDVR